LRVAMGSFYPPRAHPFYNGHTAAYAELKTRNLFLSLDGRVILNSLVNFYDTSPGTVIYGRDPIGLLPYPFSGRILSVRKIADSFPLPFQTGYGEIELTFTMPAEALGRVLPLVSSGVSGRGDILRFREVRRGWVRFGYDHWGLALWESDEIPLDPSGPHRLRLRLPALMPASAFALPAAVRESLLLEIDGSTVWLQRLPFYPAAPEQIYLGRNALGASTCEGELPGGIAEASRIASPPLVPAAARGPVVLELRLPEDLRAGTRDPLISAGGVGRADMLSVEYAAAGQVRFLLDHWGSEGARSPLIAIDYAKVHSLEINWPGLGGAAAEAGREIGGKVSVQIDGQPVWTAPAKFYAARSGDISIAENPLGASTCGPAFTGALARVQWLDFPGASP
ncbi:MAG TPA: hypothetical protein VHV47_07620, partial [Opitutaceae bacterium]|nr:hypothetical protein [Opitutaceae bacterium]